MVKLFVTMVKLLKMYSIRPAIVNTTSNKKFDSAVQLSGGLYNKTLELHLAGDK